MTIYWISAIIVLRVEGRFLCHSSFSNRTHRTTVRRSPNLLQYGTSTEQVLEKVMLFLRLSVSPFRGQTVRSICLASTTISGSTWYIHHYRYEYQAELHIRSFFCCRKNYKTRASSSSIMLLTLRSRFFWNFWGPLLSCQISKIKTEIIGGFVAFTGLFD